MFLICILFLYIWMPYPYPYLNFCVNKEHFLLKKKYLKVFNKKCLKNLFFLSMSFLKYWWILNLFTGKMFWHIIIICSYSFQTADSTESSHSKTSNNNELNHNKELKRNARENIKILVHGLMLRVSSAFKVLHYG